jgi:2-oxoglutarate ferredoxin oxidoreductase subunit gamma
MTTNLLISGEGGQGIQTIAKILAISAAESGYEVSSIPAFGVEQRGTPSLAFVIISKDKIYYPRFDRADYVVILQKRAVPKVEEYISPNTKVIFDSSTTSSDDLPKITQLIYGTPATKYAYEKFIRKTFNIIIAGKLSTLLNLDEKTTWNAIEKVLGRKFKDETIRKSNRDAYEFGRNLIFETTDFSQPEFSPSNHKILKKGFGKHAVIAPERCKGCGICIEKCPVKALKFSATLGVFATPVPDIDLEKCILCQNCNKSCPDGAIIVKKDSSSS